MSFTVQTVSWGDLCRANPIDVSERGDVVLAWVDGAMVADPHEWERPRWDANLWEQRLAGWWLTLRPDVMIGAFAGDELVGLASLRHQLQPGMAQLTTLHVSQAYRRQGIASQLMVEVMGMARAAGASRLYVSAVPSESAIGFYTSCGFLPTDAPDPDMFALEPEDIHMICEL